MKFIVSSSALLKQLQAIGGVVGTNSTLPILDNFLFHLDENEIVISASDLETTMNTRLVADMSEGQGSVAIPAKILLDTLKTLATVPVTFDVDDKNYSITLTAGEGKFRLAGQNGEDFPKNPIIEGSNKIELDSDVLYNAISKTIFAASNDDLRPAMSGVFCELAKDSITFVATDAHKLVRYRRLDVLPKVDASFIIPKKPLNQLRHILSQDDVQVVLEFNETNARFTFQNITVTCRLIDGKYPNYTAVIPKSNQKKLIVDRIPFINSIKRVSLFSNQTTYQVKFKIAGSELILNAEDLDYSNEANERLNCHFEGEDIEIGFNSKFLVEMLNNIESEQVLMELSEPNRAGLVLPATKDDKEDILMLVMPIMLNS